MDKELAELLKPLAPTVEGISKPLEVLALIALAKEFYPAEERRRLYERYAELRAADNTAYEALSSSPPHDKLGWEERVKQYGEVVANEQMAPHFEALDKRKETMTALEDFKRENGLIVRLVGYRSELANR